MHFPTHVAPSGVDTADVPEGPSRYRWRTWDRGSGGLEEVDIILRTVVDDASEKCEEYEKTAAGDKNERDQGNGRPCLWLGLSLLH